MPDSDADTSASRTGPTLSGKRLLLILLVFVLIFPLIVWGSIRLVESHLGDQPVEQREPTEMLTPDEGEGAGEL